ncbi:Cro/Cl family transcriptional regulator [Escherichia coli]|uniref:Cro/CI family transcriptional regulator n=1 Tax=Escherichia TaxID=561 RepID=UPI0005CDD84B|nr:MULTISPECIES: Cro/CI family transcriptional regulator [Escherichia]EFO0870612.1 Cro/Cl family transcriptional regulator [Escherichia coli O157]EAA1962634.1 Cro/Cl family transcriptional regulator [Escherichia coli]EED0609972.1 Cro/Cl family transcriptional regulator [Escherichia coli]EER3120756.1 Cro/Cl family transcriptional regulator [Escherichia coli]EER6575561.1 Cro/Cl family transcriptional regulator [Escherichia coli]
MKKAEAIELAGSKAKLARLLKVSKGAVSQWGEEIPELRALQLEKILEQKNVVKQKGLTHVR